jgi:hypothetical protein
MAEPPPQGSPGAPARIKVCPQCSTQHQTDGTICPWCGASYIRPPPRPPLIIGGDSWVPWIRRTLALTFLAVIGLWFTGTLDKPLSDVGLNKNPCVQNLITGATFCGDQAKELCRRTAALQDELDRMTGEPDTASGNACDDIDY